ncbi:Cys-tRNA(Pro) deacylase [Brevibacillus dissolubilis]|uniref:Cys-tRNA(Pro) deacylase n=1 Tax=Brevibacillus dissolubilis TaxID=1844116 RepID=UPI001115EA8C|nr:Cys-tRNA(Pro) deacylase [Brevibacillus dissolubilis]
MSQAKTNAMRILDAKKIAYNVYTYENQDGKIDGVSVAEKIGKDPVTVYKTLVAEGGSKNIYVFVIPVEAELDLKKAAKAVGEKKVEMLPVKDIQKWTGYIRGGCSPVGMKKAYPTLIDQSAAKLAEAGQIIVSGGKIGMQIELSVDDLCSVTGANLQDIVKS